MKFANQQLFDIKGGGSFTAPSLNQIMTDGATEYTLSVIVIDKSGSVGPFKEQLKEMLMNAAAATKSSPRSDNVLLRVLTFSGDQGTYDLSEMHGFTPASEIDLNNYPDIYPGGGTPLYIASMNAIASVVDYGKTLSAENVLVNSIVYIITDGEDTEGRVTKSQIWEKLNEIKSIKGFDSLTTILIGVTSPLPDGQSLDSSARQARQQIIDRLQAFKDEAGLSHFIDMGNANPATLAKLANLVSSSLIVKSKRVGTVEDSDDMSDTLAGFENETHF